MKTPLEEAYERATKGPLELFMAGNCVWLHAQRNPDKPERIAQREIARMKVEDDGQAVPTAALLAHAFNVLPEVVTLLSEIMRSVSTDNRQEAMLCGEYRARAEQWLAKALTVEVPE